MRHRHRPRRPPRRPRLRPAREIQTETASGGRTTGAQQRASRPAPTATRQPASHHRGATHGGTQLRDLAAAATHPQRNRPARPARPDRRSGTPPGHQLRPPPLQRRPRPQPPPPPPGGNTRRRMRLSALPPRRGPLRLRTHHCLGRRRRHMRVQCRAPLPSSPPHQTAPGLASGAAPARHPHLDHPRGPHLHHRTDHLPRLTCALILGKRGAGVSRSLAVTWSPDSAGAKYQPAAISEMTVNKLSYPSFRRCDQSAD